MNLILFDEPSVRGNLLPLTFTRPVAGIRFGILTLSEKWEKRLNCKASYKTETYLQEKFPLFIDSGKPNFWVNGSICPNDELISEITALREGEVLNKGNLLLAVNSGLKPWDPEVFKPVKTVESKTAFLRLENLWNIFRLNGEAIREDYEFITCGRKSAPLSPSNTLLGKEIFLEEGAVVECAILNTLTGPVYVGKDSEIMEGSAIRGPFALGEHAVLKMGAKIYGPTTIGPYSKVGGEVSNSVILGYSNKGHDGFLGNSVLGEWCNLGADTNNSNLKNNYGEVKLYNYLKNNSVGTGLQFCGLIMGDHSKTGINTMLNTGTVVGVSANIFGGGFPDAFVPDFSWGGIKNNQVYRLDKALEVASRVLERRDQVLDEKERKMLSHIFELTIKLRSLKPAQGL